MSTRQTEPDVMVVTITNGEMCRHLCQVTLPILPAPGDAVALGILPFRITGRYWQLTPTKLQIQVNVVRQIQADGTQHVAQAEETHLLALWEHEACLAAQQAALDALLAYISNTPDASLSDIATHLRCSPATADNYIHELILGGRLSKNDHGWEVFDTP